jgi:hypothetical protein
MESEGTVRQVSESRPSVPVSLTIQLTGSKGIGLSGRFDLGASNDNNMAE